MPSKNASIYDLNQYDMLINIFASSKYIFAMSGTKTTANYNYMNILNKMNKKLIFIENNRDLWNQDYRDLVDVIPLDGEWEYQGNKLKDIYENH